MIDLSNSKRIFGYPMKQVVYDYKFVYSPNKWILHDKTCRFVEKMNPDNNYATSKAGDIYRLPLCQYCKRESMTRMISGNDCFELYNELFNKAGVTTEQLYKLIFDKEFLLEGSYDDVISIMYGQDKWRLQPVADDRVILWHGNYIRTFDGDRFYKKGYHKQYEEPITWKDAFAAILRYDYEKYHKEKVLEIS